MRGPVEGGVVPRHDAGVAARQAAVDLTLKLYPALLDENIFVFVPKYF